MRQADHIVNFTQEDITCTSDLVKLLTTIKVVEISDGSFKEMDKELPQSIKRYK